MNCELNHHSPICAKKECGFKKDQYSQTSSTYMQRCQQLSQRQQQKQRLMRPQSHQRAVPSSHLSVSWNQQTPCKSCTRFNQMLIVCFDTHWHRASEKTTCVEMQQDNIMLAPGRHTRTCRTKASPALQTLGLRHRAESSSIDHGPQYWASACFVNPHQAGLRSPVHHITRLHNSCVSCSEVKEQVKEGLHFTLIRS